jgi:DNA topoisomerase-1
VWICPNPNGYLQATGYDAKNRKQYIYHPLWVAYRQTTKFNNLLDFGMHLPAIRATVKKDLRKKGWPKEKVLALAITLLDEYYLRVGNEQYRVENGTYGLTTLRRKHILENEGKLEISYSSKSGQYRNISIKNKRLVKLIKQTSELPGYEVFRYLENGQSKKIDSQDVNEYLQKITQLDFSAKNFRTWGGTLLAVSHYEQAVEACKQNTKLHLEACIVKKVAEGLGNTVAVCREYYIHPRVLKVLKDQQLSQYREKTLPPLIAVENLSEAEQMILRILYKFCKRKPRIIKTEQKDSVAA